LRITITGRQMDVTKGLKEHATARFEKLDKFSLNVDRVQITLRVEGTRHTAEAVVHAGKGTMLIAEVDAPDMYAALDLAASKVERQIKKHKGRLQSRRTTSNRG